MTRGALKCQLARQRPKSPTCKHLEPKCNCDKYHSWACPCHEDIVPLVLYLGPRWRWVGSFTTPAVLYPRKGLIIGGWVCPRAGLDFLGIRRETLATAELGIWRLPNTIINTGHMMATFVSSSLFLRLGGSSVKSCPDCCPPCTSAHPHDCVRGNQMQAITACLVTRTCSQFELLFSWL